MKQMIMQRSIHQAKCKVLHGSMVLAFLSALLVCSLVFPSSSKAQTGTEVVTGSETTPNYLPSMNEHTRSGGTKVNTGSGTSQGCKSGNFCTAGKQGPGGTYTSTFDLQENMSIDQINRGFEMDYDMDVDSHISNSTLASCVNGNVMQTADCRDIVNLTVSLFDGTALKHKFEHQLELDFSGVRNFAFNQTIPENTFTALTGEFAMFGIDAGFGSRFFGPAFSNPSLTTTFDLVTFIETEVIDIINNTDIIDTNIPVGENVTDIEVEVQTQEGQQIANLELEVNTEMTIEIAPLAAPIEAPTMETPVEVAEVATEIETEMSNVVEPEPTTDQPVEPTESGTDSETQTSEGSESTAEGEAGTETREPETSSGDETVEETQEETAPKPTKVVKKTSAKQKAARKIQKQMGDKGKYDSTNQLKTLIVMQVLGNSRTFFDVKKTIPQPEGFFSNKTVPDGQIADNSIAAYFLVGGSNQLHDALTGGQYKK